MSPHPSTRCGRASAVAPAALVLLAALVALVLWLTRARGDGADPDAALAPTAAATDASLVAPADAADGERLASGGASVATTEGGLVVRPGVRLPGDGRLEGRVRDRADGAGVGGARVSLWAFPPAGSNLIGRVLRLAGASDDFASRAQPVAVVASAGDGSFAFEGVRAGQYFVDAQGAWHASESYPKVAVAASGAGGPLDVWVRAGGRIVGRVLAPGGGPAAGAKVAAFQGAGSLLVAARRGTLRYVETTADAEGAFLLAGLPAGEGYEVSAMGRGFALTHATGVEVRAGADTLVVIETRSGARVSGRVLARRTGTDGEEHEPGPLRGAHVGAIPRGLRDLAFAEELLLLTHVVTDASGRYVIEHAPPGELDVLAIADGHLPGKSPVVRAPAAGAAEAGDVVLSPGPMVRGRVVDEDGAPVPDVVVRWELFAWRDLELDFTLAPLLAQAVEGFDYPRTDAEGRFVAGPFPGDPPHEIQLFKPGYRPTEHDWDPSGGDEITIELSRGGAVEGIVMDEAAAEPVTRFEIEGEDRIDLSAGAPGAWNPYSGGQLVEHESGRFRVEAVRAGASELTFSAPGYLPETVALDVAPGETTRGVIVKLRRGGTVRGVVLDEDGEPVAGAQLVAVPEGGPRTSRRERRRSTGAADFRLGDNIPPGAISLAAGIGLFGDETVLSEPDGTFELVGVAPGVLRVAGAHPDFARGESAVLELEGAAVLPDVEVVMRRGGGVYGTVRDRFGRPVVGALLFAISPEDLAGDSVASGALYDARTDASGAYSIDNVTPGGYFLVLTRPDSALHLLSLIGTVRFDLVTVPDGELVRYDVVDESASACRVFGVATADGEPLENGVIVAFGLESESVLGVDVKLAQIRAGGAYEFPGLAPGAYTFDLQVDGPDVRLDVAIPDAPEHRLDLALPRGGVRGVVLDAASGAPIGSAEVVLTSTALAEAPEGLLAGLLVPSNRGARERSERDGSFDFERLQPGEYELVAQGPARGEQSGRWAPCEPVRVVVRDGVVERGVELRLEPSLALVGVVRDRDGAPVRGARVTAFARDAIALRPPRDESDEEGRFELRALKPGTYDLSASADGFATTRVAGVALEPEGAAPLDVVLELGVSVRALVLDAGGRPVPGAIARLVALGEASAAAPRDDAERTLGSVFSGRGVSGTDGSLELGRFVPGTYRLEAQRGSARAEVERAVPADAGPVELIVRLP